MRAIEHGNDALRFFLELAALASFAYWGVQTGGSVAADIGLAAGLTLAAAALWGVFLSPKARFPLRGVFRVSSELIYFGGAAAALVTVGKPVLAAILGGLALIHLTAHHLGVSSAGTGGEAASIAAQHESTERQH